MALYYDIILFLMQCYCIIISEYDSLMTRHECGDLTYKCDNAIMISEYDSLDSLDSHYDIFCRVMTFLWSEYSSINTMSTIW